jgi:hypothetical protein
MGTAKERSQLTFLNIVVRISSVNNLYSIRGQKVRGGGRKARQVVMQISVAVPVTEV